MDVMQIALGAAITSLTSGIAGAVVASVIAYMKNSGEMAGAVRELNKLSAIGHARTAYRFALQDGFITVSDLSYIRSLADVGHRYGANGELTEIVELAERLPRKI